MKKRSSYVIFIVLFLTFCSQFTFAQVGINTDNSNPDTTAMLDVSSTDKGILIPRMNSTNRTAILNPSDGLTVYDSTTTTFWYYDNNQWNEIRNGSQTISPSDIVPSIPTPDYLCMKKIATYAPLADPTDMAFSGSIIYVLNDAANDLKIIDVQDPNNPTLLGSLNVGIFPIAIDVSGNYAYVIEATSNSMKVIDVSDPANPVLNGSITFSNPTDVVASGNYAYVTDQIDEELKVIDVSDPNNPNVVGTESIYEGPVNMALSGSYVYVLDDQQTELYTINISNPTNPTTTNTKGLSPSLTQPNNLAVFGSYMYIIADGNGALQVVDISNPSSPVLKGDLSGLGLGATAVAANSSFAFITDRIEDKLHIVNITDPDNPYIIQSIGIEGSIDSYIALSDTHAFIADSGPDDFKVIEINCPMTFQIDPVSGDFQVNNDDAPFAIGGIDLGDEGTTQGNSNLSGRGFLTSAWLYSSAIEAMDERDANSTLITLGANNGYGASDHIHLITDGTRRLSVNSTGNIGIDKPSPNFKLHLLAGANDGIKLQRFDAATNFQQIRWADQSDNLTGAISYDFDNDVLHLFNSGADTISIPASGNIGIGTSDPEYKLTIKGGTWDGTNHRGGDVKIISDDNVATGLTLRNNPGNSTYSIITTGPSAGIAAKSFAIFDNAFLAYRLSIASNGNVGIGREATTNKLEVEGNASKSSAGDWLANSDARLKTNIYALNAQETLARLLALKGVTYEWADDKTGTDRPQGIQYGFTAQNIQEVFPTLVEEDAQGYLQTAYGTYDAMYVEAIRALLNRIEHLESENQEMISKVNKIDTLESELSELKAMIRQIKNADQIAQNQ